MSVTVSSTIPWKVPAIFDSFKDMGEDVKNDLAFLADLRTRIKLSGLGPRGITIISDKLYAAEYFSGSLGVVEINGVQGSNVHSISLGKEKEWKPPVIERRQEETAKLAIKVWPRIPKI